MRTALGPARNVSGALLVHNAYPGLLHMPQHSHGPAYFSLVQTGGYEEQIGSERRLVSGPAILFHPAEEDHAVWFSSLKTRILSVHLAPELLERAKDVGLPVGRGAAMQQPAALALGARIAQEFRRNEPHSELALEALLLELLVMLGRPKDRSVEAKNKGIAIATDVLKASIHKPPSLSFLAQQAGLHPITLSRGFKAAHGCSIAEFVRKVRLELASTLLLDASCSLAEIAEECGFADQAHFSREFKRSCGTSPGLYRRTYSRR